MTRATVAVETPASLATSLRVARDLVGIEPAPGPYDDMSSMTHTIRLPTFRVNWGIPPKVDAREWRPRTMGGLVAVRSNCQMTPARSGAMIGCSHRIGRHTCIGFRAMPSSDSGNLGTLLRRFRHS